MSGNSTLSKSDSDISSALHVEMDPKTIEVKETPTSVFIGRDSWRKFMLGATSALMFVTLFLIADVIVYIVNFKAFYSLFSGYTDIWGVHAIVAYIAFVICMAIPTILPTIGRSLTIPLFIVILLCYAYIPALVMRYGWKSTVNTAQYISMGIIIWASAVIGLFVNLISTRRKINPSIGIGISSALCTICFIVFCYALDKIDPHKLILLILIALCAVLSAYLNYDALFMLNKRNDFYLNSDWFLGFVHLHTDILFRFWVDIFRKDVEYIDTNALNGKSIVLSSAIQRSKLTPISEENDEASDLEDMDRTKISGVAGAKTMV